MTPLTPLGKLITTAKVDAVNTEAPAALQRIPSTNTLPTIAAVDKVLSAKIPENVNPASALNPGLPTGQMNPVGTLGPPALTKVTKALPVAHRPVSQASSPHPADLRPSWPVGNHGKPVSEESRTVVTPVVKQTVALAPVLEKVVSATEDRSSLYLITCSIGKPLPGEEETMGDINIVQGIYTYDEVMKLRGSSIADKLSTLVTSNLSDIAPAFINMGVGLGTIEVNVMYATANKTIVARVQVQDSVEKGHGIYRTYVVSRIKPNQLVEHYA